MTDMKLKVEVNGRNEFQIAEREGGAFINGEETSYSLHKKSSNEFLLYQNQHVYQISVVESHDSTLTLNINGEESSFSDVVAVKKTSKSKNHWFYVCLFTGKNREVRKIWSSQELTVNRLIRLRYGPIFMPDKLKPGGWKKFSKNEVKKLQNLLMKGFF